MCLPSHASVPLLGSSLPSPQLARMKRRHDSIGVEEEQSLSSKRLRSKPRASKSRVSPSITPSKKGGLTPKGKITAILETPTKNKRKSQTQPNSVVQNADRSARRKSVRKLIERTVANELSDDNDLEEEEDLAEQILENEEEDGEEEDDYDEGVVSGEEGRVAQNINGFEEGPVAPHTPVKRARGRPKGSRNQLSPTSPQNLPAHERYFYQNRPGKIKTSSNTLSSLSLLSHSEYHDQISQNVDLHASSLSSLRRLHEESFPQWTYELEEDFSVCLYGYGSKRSLITSFAEYLHTFYASFSSPATIIVNGYIPTTNIHQILTTVANQVLGPSAPSKLASQLPDLLTLILDRLTSNPPTAPIYLLINSLDAAPLRRPQNHNLLAQLSSHPCIRLLATCDTPSFPLLWDISTRDQYNWIFHDATTFVSYDDGKGTGEISAVVDSVHELMGRKGANSKGRDGVQWVLKSVPENARGLYRILIAEIIALSVDDTHHGNGFDSDDDDDDERVGKAAGKSGDEMPGVEYKALYQKAVEEFLCSSEMSFRTLLKEFHDHQMVFSRRDAGGAEVIGVPMRRDEMEGLLEDLA